MNSEDFKLSIVAEQKIEELKNQYPQIKSAIMPALFLAQQELGWISQEAICWVSKKLDLPLAHVQEVASFYTMYYKKPVGKYHVQVCRTLSCMVSGAKEVTACLKKRLGTQTGEVSKDGFWSYEEVECLGSCGTAPMVQINDNYFENLTPEKLNEIMDKIEIQKPNLSFSTARGRLGPGLTGYPQSEILSKKVP